MHGKSRRACEPGSQRPSESIYTFLQWPEGLLRRGGFLILTTNTLSAAASAYLTLKNTYFTAARDHLAAARDHLTWEKTYKSHSGQATEK